MQTDAVYGKLQLCGADIARSTSRLIVLTENCSRIEGIWSHMFKNKIGQAGKALAPLVSAIGPGSTTTGAASTAAT
jgi:hypothetical protein